MAEGGALVINLYGGPGTGKSTNAALVFGKLKLAGIRAELATEYAKDLVWEERHNALGFQPYVLAKQMWRIERVRHKVEAVITDSPILLGLIYSEGMPARAEWNEFLLAVHRSWDTADFFLRRPPEKTFDPSGRSQTEDEAKALDGVIHGMLEQHVVAYSEVPTDMSDTAASVIAMNIHGRLR